MQSRCWSRSSGSKVCTANPAAPLHRCISAFPPSGIPLQRTLSWKCSSKTIFLTKLTEKIVCRLLDGRELTFHELAAVPPCVYVRKGHPLTQLEHVSEADLEGYPYSSFEQAQGVAVDFSEELPMVSMRKPSKAIIVNNRSTAMNVLANTDAYSTGSGLLAEHLSPANVVTIPLAGKDPVRLGWIYPQNAKLSSHAEGFVRLLEQSIQRSIAYTSSLHRQIVGK